MALHLIMGPMKSGKSLELIARFAPLHHSKIRHILYQPSKNDRDEAVKTRNGISLPAQKVEKIPSEAFEYEVIGIDELHMFDVENVQIIRSLVYQGKQVVACGLDMDYRGRMFPVVHQLLQIPPTEVLYRRAVCEVCGGFDQATHTQILHNSDPVLGRLPSVLAEDARYTYQARCPICFVGPQMW